MVFQLGQNLGHSPIPLRRIDGQIFYCHWIAQGLSGQKEGGVAPVSFNFHRTRSVKGLTAGYLEMICGTAESGHSLPGHVYVGTGLELAGDLNPGHTGDQGGGEQKACDELAGNSSVYLIYPRLQLPLAADGVGGGVGQTAAHPLHFLPQGGQGALGKSSFQHKRGVHSQRSNHRKQKPQSGAAVPAGQGGLGGDGLGGMNFVAVLCPVNVRPQSSQALGGGLNIPVGLGTHKPGGRLGKGGTDQHSVSLRFRGNGLGFSGKKTGRDSDVHIKDLPVKWIAAGKPGWGRQCTFRWLPAESD